MNDRSIGFRDVTTDPVKDDLRWRLTQSPTGRQLSIDGSFVAPVVTDDPNTSDEIPPDGTVVIYSRSGTLELWGFTREDGWQQF